VATSGDDRHVRLDESDGRAAPRAARQVRSRRASERPTAIAYLVSRPDGFAALTTGNGNAKSLPIHRGAMVQSLARFVENQGPWRSTPVRRCGGLLRTGLLPAALVLFGGASCGGSATETHGSGGQTGSGGAAVGSGGSPGSGGSRTGVGGANGSGGTVGSGGATGSGGGTGSGGATGSGGSNVDAGGPG
jgi:hypothetical protein